MPVWLKSLYCSIQVASLVITTHNRLFKKLSACPLQLLSLGKGPDVPCDVYLKRQIIHTAPQCIHWFILV